MIVVTGATGRIGKALVLQLSGGGFRVRALVRDRAKAMAITNPNVEIVVCDTSRPEALTRYMKGADHLFLLTAADPLQVEHQGSLVEAARRAEVQHVVKLSVFGASPDAPTALGRWHAQTEQQIETSGLQWTHLRPQFFMQNLLGFAPAIANDRTLQAPLGAGRIAMVDSRDVAAVAAVVLTNPGHAGHTYEITGPDAVSFQDIVSKINRVTDQPVSYVDMPPDRAREEMLAAGLPTWMADDLSVLYTSFRNGQGATVTNVVQKVTGYEPRSIDHFVREHAFTFGA